MNVSPELISGVLIAIVGGGGVWSYLSGKGRNKVDLITIAQDAAKEMFDEFREEIGRLRLRIVELEAQDERCRAELTALKARLDG